MKGLSVPQFPRSIAPPAFTRELLLCTTFPHSYCAVHFKIHAPPSLPLSLSLSVSTATGLFFTAETPGNSKGTFTAALLTSTTLGTVCLLSLFRKGGKSVRKTLMKIWWSLSPILHKSIAHNQLTQTQKLGFGVLCKNNLNEGTYFLYFSDSWRSATASQDRDTYFKRTGLIDQVQCGSNWISQSVWIHWIISYENKLKVVWPHSLQCSPAQTLVLTLLCKRLKYNFGGNKNTSKAHLFQMRTV